MKEFPALLNKKQLQEYLGFRSRTQLLQFLDERQDFPKPVFRGYYSLKQIRMWEEKALPIDLYKSLNVEPEIEEENQEEIIDFVGQWEAKRRKEKK